MADRYGSYLGVGQILKENLDHQIRDGKGDLDSTSISDVIKNRK